jgi:hypothetical protein
MHTITEPVRVNVRSRVFELAHGDGSAINITRSGKYGNPFVIGRDGDRETVIGKFFDWLKSDPDAAFFRADIRKGVFVGKTIGCACASSQPCHGDVIVEFSAKHARVEEPPTFTEIKQAVDKHARVDRERWIAQAVRDNDEALSARTSDFNVIVAGSREFSDKHLMHDKLTHYLSRWLPNARVTIISGGARGADRLGERWGAKYAHNVHRIAAPWGTFGTSAGHIRNEVMAQVANACIVFWDGESAGTKGMIAQAEAAGIPVRVVRY